MNTELAEQRLAESYQEYEKAMASGNIELANEIAEYGENIRQSLITDIDTATGVSGEIRAGMGLADTEEDRLTYLKQHYQDAYMKDGDAIVVNEKGQHVQANPNGLDLGDLAENGRIVAQFLGGGIGGMLGAPLAPATGGGSVVAGGALGAEIADQAYDQVMSNIYGVGDTRTVGQQVIDAASDVAIDAAVGKLGDIAINAAPKAIGALSDLSGAAYHKGFVQPVQNVARAFNGSRPNIANEGALLEGRVGVNFMPGQRTGNKFDLIKENWLRGQAGSADVIDDIDHKNIGILERYTDDLARSLGSSKPTYEVGNSVESVFKGIGDGLESARRTDWLKNMEGVKSVTGDAKFISYNHSLREIDSMIDEFGGIGTAESKKIVKELEGVKESLLKPQDISSWHGKYSHFSAASAGKGNIFKDLDKGRSRAVSARLKGALDADLEASAKTLPDDVYDAFDTARRQYREQSQSLEAMAKSAIGRLAGNDTNDVVFGNGVLSDKSGHAIYKKLIGLDPGEMKRTVKILNGSQDGKRVLNEVKSTYIQEALESGRNVTPSAGMSEFSTNKLVRGLEKMDRDQMKAIGFTREEMQVVDDIKKVAVRLGDRTGFNFSGTNISQEFGEFVAPETSAGMLSKLASGVARQLSAQRMALDMLPKEERAAAKRIIKLSKGFKQLKPPKMSIGKSAAEGALTGSLTDFVGVLAE